MRQLIPQPPLGTPANTMTPLSLRCPSPITITISSSSSSSFPTFRRLHHHKIPIKPIRAAQLPPRPPPIPPPGSDLYQPFRPPPSPLPSRYHSLSTDQRLDVLRNRLGLWFEFAPIIPTLSQEGFTPPSIEEATGLTGVEQNRLVVAVQVRDSLVSAAVPDDVISFFDVGGAELLYELRLLNGPQRAACAAYIIAHRLDPKGSQKLARAVKDFPRRRGEPGWSSFSGKSPADCLAFAEFRLSGEAMSDAKRVAALERALQTAETEAAKERIERALKRAAVGEEGEAQVEAVEAARLPVVRLRYGEVAEASSVVLLPACDATMGAAGVVAAPGCRPEGVLGVVAAEKGWGKWAVLPGWGPVMGVRLGGGVAVAFPDAKSMPWKMSGPDKHEPLLVVVDKGRRKVAPSEESGFYLVEKDGGMLVVESGKKLIEKGTTEAVATVVLVVRPPRDDTDYQMSKEEWD